jgi:hypothetical protein
MPSNPSPKKLKEAGMDEAFAPKADPSSIAGMIAQAYAARVGKPKQSPAPSAIINPQGNAPSVKPTPAMNPHMIALHEAAEAAKQKYMLENGVDENGEPIQK